jgi:hypothetical protein
VSSRGGWFPPRPPGLSSTIVARAEGYTHALDERAEPQLSVTVGRFATRFWPEGKYCLGYTSEQRGEWPQYFSASFEEASADSDTLFAIISGEYALALSGACPATHPCGEQRSADRRRLLQAKANAPPPLQRCRSCES